MGTSVPRNWRLTNCPETTKMMQGRPLMTNLKMTVTDDCAVSACNPPPLFIKALAPACWGEEVSLWADVCYPTPLVASI